jgi:hypothetical protein
MNPLLCEKKHMAREYEQDGSRAWYTHLACFGKWTILLIVIRLCGAGHVGRFFLTSERKKAGDFLRSAHFLAEIFYVASTGMEPGAVAQVILRAATARPRLRYLVGRDAKVLLSLKRLLPESLFERVLRRVFRSGNPADLQPRAQAPETVA